MSPVCTSLGTIELSCHVVPPSSDTKIGARLPPSGSGVNAVPTIWFVLPGLTANDVSLSWFVSSLNDFGIMLTSNRLPPPGREFGALVTGLRVPRRRRAPFGFEAAGPPVDRVGFAALTRRMVSSPTVSVAGTYLRPRRFE